jgi:hypothetical protein
VDLTHDPDEENVDADDLSVVDIENVDPARPLTTSFRGRPNTGNVIGMDPTNEANNDIVAEDNLVDAYRKSLLCKENHREIELIERGTHPLLKSIREVIAAEEDENADSETPGVPSLACFL